MVSDGFEGSTVGTARDVVRRKAPEPKTAIVPSSDPAPPDLSRPASPSSKRGGGPKTAAGRKRSSQNALRHGIYSRSPVVGSESAEDWKELVEGLFEDLLRPANTTTEREYVFDIAMDFWNLRRVHSTISFRSQNRTQVDVEKAPPSGPVSDFLPK